MTNNKRTQQNFNEVEDMMIADVILKGISDSQKLKDSLKELAIKLNRTEKSVENRWYTTLQKQYKQVISELKRERRAKKAKNIKVQEEVINEKTVEVNNGIISEEVNEITVKETPLSESNVNYTMTIENVIEFLQKNKNSFNSNTEVQQLQKRIDELLEENSKYKKENEALLNQNKQLNEDFGVLANVINNARKFTNNENVGVTYKTDNKGNVEIKK